MEMKRNSDSLARLNDLIKDIDFTMLSTIDNHGCIRSRPMSTQQIDAAGSVWLFASDDSPKSLEIGNENRVNLSYADPSSQRYVSMSGHAYIVHDLEKAKELWNPFYKAWFPKGLEDPHLCLIRVDVEQAEYWDAPSSKMVQLFGFLKAALTGQPLEKAGENRKIQMH